MYLIYLLISVSYVDVKSPTVASWAFLMIYHVPRSLIDHCSTTLISLVE